MKRFVISAILTLLFTLSARAGYDFEVDGIYYRIISLSEMTCAVVDPGENYESGYYGDIVIPDEVSFKGRTLKVTRIAKEAFYNSDISSLVIGPNVLEIEEVAVSHCNYLEMVVITPGTQPLSVGWRGLESNYEYGSEIIIGRNMVYKELYTSFSLIRFSDMSREIPGCPAREYYSPDEREVGELEIGSNVLKVGNLSKMIIAEGCYIIVRAVNPPKAEAFSNKAYVNSVLYVPDESVEKYRNAPVWKNFWEILPMSEVPSLSETATEQIDVVDSNIRINDNMFLNLEDDDTAYEIAEYKEEEVVEEEVEEEIPFQLVEDPPSFMGGTTDEFNSWVAQHIVYPKIAKENGVSGKVITQFTIAPDGSVTNVKVVRGVDPALDAEAIRVIKSSPKWNPGKAKGVPVKVSYTFPVVFQFR